MRYSNQDEKGNMKTIHEIRHTRDSLAYWDISFQDELRSVELSSSGLENSTCVAQSQISAIWQSLFITIKYTAKGEKTLNRRSD